MQFTEKYEAAGDNSRELYLEKQVTSLQREFAALKDRVTNLEQARDTAEFSTLRENKPKKRRGPCQKIRAPELHENRDRLVCLLEPIWPSVAERLGAFKTPQDVRLAFTDLFVGPSTPGQEDRTLPQLADIQRQFLENAGPLLAFIKSARFRRKPTRATVTAALDPTDKHKPWQEAAARLPARQIANALAGVPDINWRTSLDRCSKVPSLLTVGSCQYFARMYGLNAYWIHVVAPEPKAYPNDRYPNGTRVIGPVFSKRDINNRAEELRAAGRQVHISFGRADESPAPLPVPIQEGTEQGKPNNESSTHQ